MSRHDDSISINEMLEHAREAVELLGDSTLPDLQNNRVVQLALTRLVEIVGEAAWRVSVETQQSNPALPWPQIIGMRHRLAHGYDMIDLDVLWDTITYDLPPLIGMLERILAEDSI